MQPLAANNNANANAEMILRIKLLGHGGLKIEKCKLKMRIGAGESFPQPTCNPGGGTMLWRAKWSGK